MRINSLLESVSKHKLRPGARLVFLIVNDIAKTVYPFVKNGEYLAVRIRNSELAKDALHLSGMCSGTYYASVRQLCRAGLLKKAHNEKTGKVLRSHYWVKIHDEFYS